MPSEPIRLFFYGRDAALLARLKSASTDMPWITCEHGTAKEVAKRVSLDAVWAGLIAAAELFGLAPPFPIHKAVVLRIPERQMQRGFPKFCVAGVALSPTDPKTPEFRLRLTVSSLFRAVRDYNLSNKEQVARVGIQPEELQLPKVSPELALGVVRESYARFK
jgi:hypothetical protein